MVSLGGFRHRQNAAATATVPGFARRRHRRSLRPFALPVRTALAVALLAISLVPAHAAGDDSAAEIRAALDAWTNDFNARRADKVCGLFEPGLIYDFQGLPEQRYGDICPRLKRALADDTRSWTYAQPDIKEILVFGDVAVVRLTWTSTVTGGPEGAVKSVEPGMDIFRRQPDGSWKIMRYMAFSQ
jgi:ketosteroid isomerase-like protein